MKNILILTDFSTNSWNSIKYTLDLFKDKVIHFYILKAHSKIDATYLIHEKEKISDEFQELLVKIEALKTNKHHTFLAVKSTDNLIDATKKQILKFNIDLIVTGINRHSKNIEISKSAEELITKVPCDVMVIPQKSKFSNYNQVAVTTQFTNFMEAKLVHDLALNNTFENSKFNFIFFSINKMILNENQQWNKNAVEDFFNKIPFEFHNAIGPHFLESLNQINDKINTKLIVCTAKNLNLLEQLLFRPSTKNIGNLQSIPFLVLAQNNR